MPSGLQVFDATGQPVDDITSKFSRKLGSFVIPAVRPTSVTSHAGSISVPDSGAGDIYWEFTLTGSQVATWITAIYPDVTISGNTLNWSYAMLNTEDNRAVLEEMFLYIGGITIEYGRYV